MSKQADRSPNHERPDDRKPGEVYGWVLVLRGLERAALKLGRYPSALRVLCVMAAYMNGEGRCRVGQSAIAARLEMTRQAVGKHIARLQEEGVLLFDPEEDAGKTIRYTLNLEGLEAERDHEFLVTEVRLARKRQRIIDREKRAGHRPVSFRERTGFPAWAAFLNPHTMLMSQRDEQRALDAMDAAERNAGVICVPVYDDEDNQAGGTLYSERKRPAPAKATIAPDF